MWSLASCFERKGNHLSRSRTLPHPGSGGFGNWLTFQTSEEWFGLLNHNPRRRSTRCLPLTTRRILFELIVSLQLHAHDKLFQVENQSNTGAHWVLLHIPLCFVIAIVVSFLLTISLFEIILDLQEIAKNSTMLLSIWFSPQHCVCVCVCAHLCMCIVYSFFLSI